MTKALKAFGFTFGVPLAFTTVLAATFVGAHKSGSGMEVAFTLVGLGALAIALGVTLRGGGRVARLIGLLPITLGLGLFVLASTPDHVLEPLAASLGLL